MIRDLLISWLLGRTAGIKDFFFFLIYRWSMSSAAEKDMEVFSYLFLHFIMFLKKIKIFLIIFYFKLIFFLCL